MVNVPKHRSNVGPHHVYHIYWPLASKLFSKKSLLLTSEIFPLLVNSLATDEMYLVLNRDNLTIPIQMQLSQKQNPFYDFFVAFFKSSLNFQQFFKKDDPRSF